MTDLADDDMCNIVIYVYDTNLCSVCDQTSDLQLELVSELESVLRDIVH